MTNRTPRVRGGSKLPRTLRLRGEAIQCASMSTLTYWVGHARGLACAKTKKFPCIFLASPPPVTDIFLLENSATPPRAVALRPCESAPRFLTLRREAEKEMERKFLVLLRRFRLQNELVLFYYLS